VPFDIGLWEVVILLAVLALLFGAKGVPEVARRLGTGVREMKDAVGEVDPRRMLEADPDKERADKSKPESGKEPEA
jgi:sec-independent protein translocase protein TatA